MRSWPIIAGLLLLSCLSCSKPIVESSPIEPDPITTPSTDLAAHADPSPANAVVTDVAPAEVEMVKPKEVQVVSFDELNLGMPEDSKFRPIMLNFNDGRAKELQGCRINIAGHMNPPDELTGLKEFVLLKNKECKFGPGGQADHLIRVFMKDGKTANYTDKVVYVEGLLSIEPFPVDGPSTWSIYDMEATAVTTRAPSRQRL